MTRKRKRWHSRKGVSFKRWNGHVEGQKVEVLNEIVYWGVKLDSIGRGGRGGVCWRRLK